MRICLIIILSFFLSVGVFAQNYSSDVTFVEKAGNTLTVRSSGLAAKKKEAAPMAIKSAFYTLFYMGVDGVNQGNPIITESKAAYDTRFFDENRYAVFVKQSREMGEPVKSGSGYRTQVEVTILWDALQKDLARNNVQTNLGMTVGTPSSQVKLPTVLVVPYEREGEDVRYLLENNQMLSLAVSRVTEAFNRQGYKTKDFVAQLKLLKRNDVLTAGSQSDAVSKIIQNSGADIIVSTKVFITTHANRQSEVTLDLQASEFQTAGVLASASFLSGKYNTTDTTRLVDYALKKIHGDFFTRLQNSFNDIVKNGREIRLQMVLSKAVTDWDFESTLPDNRYFLDAMEDWLMDNSLKGVYNMNSSGKVIDISMQIPIYDEERGRAFTTSNFSSQLRTALNAMFGGDYTVSITTIGQGLTVTVQ